jgi:hypothetical protein
MDILCNICENEIGLKWCSCIFKMCEICAKSLNVFECCNCRKSLKKRIYFAGKIFPSRFINFDKRILVLDTTDKNETLQHLSGEKNIGIVLNSNSVITLSYFLNVKKKLPTINCERHILVGPCIILKDNVFPQHGWFADDNPLVNINKNSNITILNKRNIEMITNCDIFILTLNKNTDCFCAIKEWGIALSYNKIMVIDYEIHRNLDETNDYECYGSKLHIHNYSSLKEFYTFAQDSIDSFEKLDVLMRDTIIKSIPDFMFNDWITYKIWLQKIIQSK